MVVLTFLGRYLLIEAKAIFISVTIICLCDLGTAFNTITMRLHLQYRLKSLCKCEGPTVDSVTWCLSRSLKCPLSPPETQAHLGLLFALVLGSLCCLPSWRCETGLLL